MNSQNNSNTKEENQKEDLDSLRVLLECKDRYHDHKETMAHAAILIQLGILAFLFKMDFDHKIAVLIGYVLMWAIISGYMLWQLDYRRETAHQVDELIEKLKDKAKDNSLHEVLNRMKGTPNGTRIGECILWTADVLILIIALLKIFIS